MAGAYIPQKKGYMIYYMELSLPYLTLRKIETPAASNHGAAEDINRRADLSFLDLSGSTTQPNGSRFVIQEATTSFTICGASDYQWTGYAFNYGTSFDNEEGIFDDTLEEDLFVSGDSDSPRVICNNMDWNPSIYFLRCLESRMDKVCREWTYLIYSLEHGSKNWVSTDFSTLAHTDSETHQE